MKKWNKIILPLGSVYILSIFYNNTSIELARITTDENERWIYTSRYICVEDGDLRSNNLSEAKEELEDLIISYLEQKVTKYEEFIELIQSKEDDENGNRD